MVDFEQEDKDYRELMYAVEDGKVDVVERLLSKGVGPCHGGLVKAALRGDCDMIRLLLRKGDAIDDYYDGYTPLSAAVYGNQLRCAEYLLELGANVDWEGEPGDGPIHQVVRRTCKYKDTFLEEDFQSWLKLLTKYGVNLDLLNDDGQSAIHLAVRYVELDAVRHLLDAGANPNIEDTHGRTALRLAVTHDPSDIERLLVRFDAQLGGQVH